MKNPQSHGSDWQPEQYLKFKKERMRPASDLMNRIECENVKRIADMGCGPGNNTVLMADKWKGAEVIGLDNSDAMLAKAAGTFTEGVKWMKKDISGDLSELGKFDVIFSNAVLQWLEDKDDAVRRLFGMLNKKGALAAQVPYPVDIPFKKEIRKLASSDKWRQYTGELKNAPKFYPAENYYRLLKGLSRNVDIWQTEYLYGMTLENIIDWDKGAGLRPYMEALPDEAKRQEFLEDYREAVRKVYAFGNESDEALVPFPRIFFIAYNV